MYSMNNYLAGNIPGYLVAFPCIQQLSDKKKRSLEHTEVYMIKDLPIPDMMVKLRHNTKLSSTKYFFSSYQLLEC